RAVARTPLPDVYPRFADGRTHNWLASCSDLCIASGAWVSFCKAGPSDLLRTLRVFFYGTTIITVASVDKDGGTDLPSPTGSLGYRHPTFLNLYCRGTSIAHLPLDTSGPTRRDSPELHRPGRGGLVQGHRHGNTACGGGADEDCDQDPCCWCSRR
ncbi:unnamed protein product, partial [Ectocarpus sp. 12 AP-2014]